MGFHPHFHAQQIHTYTHTSINGTQLDTTQEKINKSQSSRPRVLLAALNFDIPKNLATTRSKLS